MDNIGIHNSPTISSTAISRGCYDLHPGPSAGPCARPAASHSGTPQTDKPPQSTLGYILSKTMGLSRHSPLLAGERPNTDVTFSVSLSNESLRPSAANVVHTDGIADLLK